MVSKISAAFFLSLSLSFGSAAGFAQSADETALTKTLSEEFVLSRGSEVYLNSSSANEEAIKALDRNGQMMIQQFYQVQKLGANSGLAADDLQRFNAMAAAGALYLPAQFFTGTLNASGGVQALSQDARLYRASEAIDPEPGNPKVRPQFSAADQDDQRARVQALVPQIESLQQVGGFSNKCPSALAAGVPSTAINAAMNCYQQNKSIFKNPMIVIMDLTKPSTQKRFFVLDANTGQLLSSDYAMHGRGVGSGAGSHKTPAGMHYLDQSLYRSGRPYKLGVEMKGLESRNKNSHARAIRLHDWGLEKDIAEGFSPPTWGCVGVSDQAMQSLQGQVSGGSLMFNYTGSKEDEQLQNGVCSFKKP